MLSVKGMFHVSASKAVSRSDVECVCVCVFDLDSIPQCTIHPALNLRCYKSQYSVHSDTLFLLCLTYSSLAAN